jgi:hypothetical protein
VFRRDVNKGDYALRKGRHKRLEQNSFVVKRATGEGKMELDGVKEDLRAIEVGGESRGAAGE